jgi:thiamine-phosphate pyrophosphorylase
VTGDRRERLRRARLYLVIEARPRGSDPEPLLEAALRGGVDIVQLREKELADDDLVAAARPFRRLCAEHGALFVLNDRPDLVKACDADGVHVGQDDAPAAEARRAVGPELLVGLSTHAPEHFDHVESADYLGVGPVFETPTKPDSAAVGLDLVRIAAQRVTLPFFAIGGIEPGTVGLVVAAGAERVAVVRAVRDADDPEAAARVLRAQLPA